MTPVNFSRVVSSPAGSSQPKSALASRSAEPFSVLLAKNSALLMSVMRSLNAGNMNPYSGEPDTCPLLLLWKSFELVI